jgi:hypothetical protein
LNENKDVREGKIKKNRHVTILFTRSGNSSRPCTPVVRFEVWTDSELESDALFGWLHDTHDTQKHLDTQKLQQQPRHTTPRLKNSKIHTTRKKIGEKRNNAKCGHQTNLKHRKINNQAYNTADTNARKERP